MDLKWDVRMEPWRFVITSQYFLISGTEPRRYPRIIIRSSDTQGIEYCGIILSRMQDFK